MTDTEMRLRALWDAQSIPKARQDELVAGLVARADPAADVGGGALSSARGRAGRMDSFPAVSEEIAPIFSDPVAYGYAGNVQIFAEYENAEPETLALARQLCAERGLPDRPALVSIASGIFYISRRS